MALPKQIRKVKYEFVSGATSLASGQITLNDYAITIQHENPLGNPTYSKSLNGYLVPYGVKSRAKFDLKFNKMVGTDITSVRNMFNDIITYHNATGVTFNLFYRWTDIDGATSAEKIAVVLESPVEMVQRYTSQIGSFAPSISLISQELTTSVSSTFEGV